MPFEFNPQDEESKESLTMPQAVYLEARALQDSIATTNQDLRLSIARLAEGLKFYDGVKLGQDFIQNFLK